MSDELLYVGPLSLQQVLRDVVCERTRQDKKWGEQNHDFGSWLEIFLEELGEASRARMEARYRPGPSSQKINFRTELVESIAVLTAAVECGDRNGWFR